jgi:hypothetical protein
MVEKRPLTDSELDAALTEAFAVGPSPDFVARLCERLASEEISGRRRFPFVAALVTLAAAAIVFVVVMLDRRPALEQTPTRVAATSEPRTSTAASDTTAAGSPAVAERMSRAALHRAAKSRQVQPIAEEMRDERDHVLIPAGEQQALRRLFERPPTAVVRFTPSVDPTDVAAIAIPPLRIDPLSPVVEEGGHQ